MKERSEPAIDPAGVYALSPEVVSAAFDDQIWLYSPKTIWE